MENNDNDNNHDQDGRTTARTRNDENSLHQTRATLSVGLAVSESEQEETPFRRSSSLRIEKKHASSTPAQKKMVRFADVFGLDLASVRTFLEEWPPVVEVAAAVPKSAYDDQDLDHDRDRDTAESRTLVPTFGSLPVESADFADRVRCRRVCLETVCVRESPVRHIAGRIIVANLDFCKSVYVRYTSDEWKTHAEVRATYVSPEPEHAYDQSYDRFAFVIYVYDTVTAGGRIEFAIRYHCGDSVYWDNNDGNNYAFRRAPPIDVSPSCNDNFHHPFY